MGCYVTADGQLMQRADSGEVPLDIVEATLVSYGPDGGCIVGAKDPSGIEWQVAFLGDSWEDAMRLGLAPVPPAEARRNAEARA